MEIEIEAAKKIMVQRKICVIIPTYNNARTLTRVVDSVLQYTSDIILVNDGSTDGTANIVAAYPQIHVLTHQKNSGKGRALRNGFEKARSLGFTHAITIDSDGQHYASDIPKFLAGPGEEELLIGSRNMTQLGVPKKSSFGNTFSNFWFWFETGIRLEDTQSGYRLYPLHSIPKKYFTSKFEFEIEVIVRSAWRDVPVRNVPINVLYDPGERVSHFRPFKDFTRISILNTVLVVIALLYIFPGKLFRKIKKKGLRRFLLENILESDDSNAKKALSISLGVFIGISPFWGFQTVLVVFLAVLFRLNKAISFAFSNISFPPFIPFIIYASLEVGALFFRNPVSLSFNKALDQEDIKSHIAQYLIGSFTLAALCAIVFGLSAYALLAFFTNFRNKK